MHGNAWEWVRDRRCPDPEGAVAEPIGACDSDNRVIRGGSWHFGAGSARCGLRCTHGDAEPGPSLGFRMARDLPPARVDPCPPRGASLLRRDQPISAERSHRHHGARSHPRDESLREGVCYLPGS